MEIPSGMYLRIASRTSLAHKGISVGAGVIDNDYRGEIIVLLQNSTDKEYIIPFQSRIAQFIFEHNTIPCITVSKTLTQTSQGQGWFGSTNLSSDIHFINRIKAKEAVSKEQTLRNTLRSHKVDEDPATAESDQLLPRVPKLPPEIRKYMASLPVAPPKVLPENSVNNSLPKTARFSQDFLAQATGFYNNKNIMKYLSSTGLENVIISIYNGPPLSDKGHQATM